MGVFSRFALSVVVAAAVGLLAASSACQRRGGADAADATESDRATPVYVQRVLRGPVDEVASGTGVVEASYSVAVVARSQGTVVELHVDLGDEVSAGDVLVEQVNELADTTVSKASTELRSLRRRRKEQADLAGRGLVPSSPLNELDAQIAQARLALQEAKQGRSELVVEAPRDGVVVGVQVEVGATVMPGAPLLTIADVGRLRLRLPMSERELARVTPGMVAEIRSVALPEAAWGGTVSQLEPTVDAASGTIRAVVDVGPAMTPLAERVGLRPGMYVEASIRIEHRPDALLVSRQALLYQEDRAVVYRVVDGKAELVAVELGVGRGDDIEVTAGLSAGDQVIVVGQSGLQPGTAVEVKEAAPTPILPLDSSVGEVEPPPAPTPL